MMQDGPLRQPFADYMKMTETNAEYDVHSLNQQAALHMIPQEILHIREADSRKCQEHPIKGTGK
eukprot:6247973-Amphidinium_carterae.1